MIREILFQSNKNRTLAGTIRASQSNIRSVSFLKTLLYIKYTLICFILLSNPLRLKTFLGDDLSYLRLVFVHFHNYLIDFPIIYRYLWMALAESSGVISDFIQSPNSRIIVIGAYLANR